MTLPYGPLPVLLCRGGSPTLPAVCKNKIVPFFGKSEPNFRRIRPDLFVKLVPTAGRVMTLPYGLGYSICFSLYSRFMASMGVRVSTAMFRSSSATAWADRSTRDT